MAFTNQQQRAYLAEFGSICPRCRSRDIESREIDSIDGDVIVQGAGCNACGREWQDIFRLAEIADPADFASPEEEPWPLRVQPKHFDGIDYTLVGWGDASANRWSIECQAPDGLWMVVGDLFDRNVATAIAYRISTPEA